MRRAEKRGKNYPSTRTSVIESMQGGNVNGQTKIADTSSLFEEVEEGKRYCPSRSRWFTNGCAKQYFSLFAVAGTWAPTACYAKGFKDACGQEQGAPKHEADWESLIIESQIAYPDPHSLLAKANMSFRDDVDTVVSVDCRNLCENEELSGTIQAKENGGYSLNYQNPCPVGCSPPPNALRNVNA